MSIKYPDGTDLYWKKGHLFCSILKLFFSQFRAICPHYATNYVLGTPGSGCTNFLLGQTLTISTHRVVCYNKDRSPVHASSILFPQIHAHYLYYYRNPNSHIPLLDDLLAPFRPLRIRIQVQWFTLSLTSTERKNCSFKSERFVESYPPWNYLIRWNISYRQSRVSDLYYHNNSLLTKL